jgi:phage shock protein E
MRKTARQCLVLLLLATALPCLAEPLDLNKRQSLSPKEAASLQQEVIFLDVRSAAEWEAGHIKGAIHIPYTEAAGKVASVIPDRSVPIVTYCSVGGRASYVVDALRKQGYTVVPVTRGGYLQLIGYGMEKE